MLVGWITAFFVGIDLFIVAPLLPSIGDDLGMAPASLAILVSAFGLAYAVTCPVLGYVAERIGARKVLCLGLASLGAANLYTAMAPDLHHLLASRWLAGMAAASTTPMVYALAAERSRPERRGSSLALVNSGLVLALVGGAPLGLLLGQVSGWRDVFAALGVLFIVMLPVHLATWRFSRHAAAPVAPSGDCAGQLGVGVRILVCTGLWSASVYAAYTLLGTAIREEFGASTGVVAAALAAFGIGATAGGLAGGKLADRWGSRRFVRLSLVAMCVCLTLTGLTFPAGGLPTLAAALFLIALASYGFFPALQSYASAAMPARRKMILGFMSSALYLGIAAGSSAGAAIYSASGYRMVLAASTATALLGLLVSAQLRQRLDQ
ncbi:MAG: MFS transporter [Ramlibacter sp.]|nr:MFS transporter [Ramlibacter sp.]